MIEPLVPIDLVCDHGLRSLNWHTGDTRVAQLAAEDPPLQMPTALTYGPDGLLYVLDTEALIAYRVQH